MELDQCLIYYNPILRKKEETKSDQQQMTESGEIWVVSAAGQGHLQPCMELCNHLLSLNFHTTIVIPSSLSSAIPSSFSQNALSQIVPITVSSGPPRPGPDPLRQQAALELESHLSSSSTRRRRLCAVVDFQMGWTKEVFWKYDIPVVGFFTFGACAAAMEWGAWKVQAADLRPDETREIPGLPESMALTFSDLKRKSAGPPRGGDHPGGPKGGPRGGPKGGGGGPPKPGNRPPWVPEVEGSVGLMFNTCDSLERPFIDYMTEQMGIPTWGVGPLLPESYWKPSESSYHQIKAQPRQSNYTEESIVKWMDGKPAGSVLYVAFGSEVGPTADEYPQLASALEEQTGPFVWVIQSGAGGSQPGYYPDGLESRVGDRGLIIKGWAPQLLILSHPSTGGFLSHCGWNSTAEALGRGVPFLGWPVRGDQYFNAKLVVNHLKVGYRVAEDLSEMVRKEDIVTGIESLMGDAEVKERAVAIRNMFEDGFPASSIAALNAFGDFITSQKAE